MNEIQVFNFESHNVRTVIGENGEPKFVAADVAGALTISRTDDAVSRLDDDEKDTAIIRTPGGDQRMTVITESGLYNLIFTSRKEEAKRFKKWVTAEVLPTIRKTGQYAVATPQPQPTLSIFKPEVEELRSYLETCNLFLIPVHMAQVEAVKHVRLACGVDYSNLLKIAPAQQNLEIEDVYLEPTELGKKLGHTPMKMNLVLCNLGLQEKTVSGWEPTTAGKQICTIHQWANGSKSGVNLKWKLSAVRAMAEAAKK